MSFKLPIGVATIYTPKSLLFINLLFIFIISCTPVNLSNKSQKADNNIKVNKPNYEIDDQSLSSEKSTKKPTNENEKLNDYDLNKNIAILISENDQEIFTKQLINIIELGVYNKNLKNVKFEILYYEDNKQLKEIISENNSPGKIFIGPIDNKNTKTAKSFCKSEIIFFSFSSEENLAGNCIYLINFFPKNELENLFSSIPLDSKVALLYPENNYGYLINLLIDDVINKSDAVLVNRASYKKDLSNVRDAIKELGKYELRKYELERQKQILILKDDTVSNKRLKKLKKFKTTSDYDFTHILIADYGLSLLQVAPLLPYYDIDPNIVQFLGTGVIDDENFFNEPSLQGAIFPGVEKTKRIFLIDQYNAIYDERLLRVSTLPYDLLGLLNYIYSQNISLLELRNILNNSKLKFDGVDGEFYFKDNKIERNLDILKINNGTAKKIN